MLASSCEPGLSRLVLYINQNIGKLPCCFGPCMPTRPLLGHTFCQGHQQGFQQAPCQFSSPDLRLWLGWHVYYCPQAAAPWLRHKALAPLITLFLELTQGAPGQGQDYHFHFLILKSVCLVTEGRPKRQLQSLAMRKKVQREGPGPLSSELIPPCPPPPPLPLWCWGMCQKMRSVLRLAARKATIILGQVQPLKVEL